MVDQNMGFYRVYKVLMELRYHISLTKNGRSSVGKSYLNVSAKARKKMF